MQRADKTEVPDPRELDLPDSTGGELRRGTGLGVKIVDQCRGSREGDVMGILVVRKPVPLHNVANLDRDRWVDPRTVIREAVVAHRDLGRRAPDRGPANAYAGRRGRRR